MWAQRSYINAVSKLSRYFGRSPERLELECVSACNFDPPVDFGRRLTLLRFDPVYAGHFKCNRRRIADYKNLSGYLRDLYQHPGMADTCTLSHITKHYYQIHLGINPSGIVPLGPGFDLWAGMGEGGFVQGLGTDAETVCNSMGRPRPKL
jgi:glutathionyl-hydroquinone reductase